jgi:hypothetical protein
VDALRSPLRPLARSPTPGKAARVLGLGFFLGVLAAALPLVAYLAASEATKPCFEARDMARCVADRFPLIRAPFGAAFPFFLAAAFGSAVLGGASAGILSGALEERPRLAEARSRLARAEDAYARGVLSAETFHAARALLEATPRSVAARHEARVALGGFAGLALLLGPAAVFAWAVHGQRWNASDRAVLPGAGALTLAVGVAAAAWLALAWRGAAREAREAGAREQAAFERTWARVLEESRARTLAPAER